MRFALRLLDPALHGAFELPWALGATAVGVVKPECR